MDTSRTVEKLIILLNYSEGVLVRLYHAIQFQPPSNSEMKRLPSEISKWLSRELPDPTVGIADLPTFTVVTCKRDALKNETKLVYDVFEDVMQTGTEISHTLTHIAQNILPQDFDSNGDVLTRLFDLLSHFVKMHLLASRLSSVARTAVLLRSVLAPQQDSVTLIRRFLHELCAPYTYMRKMFDVAPLAFVLCLERPTRSLSTWMDIEALTGMNLFAWDAPQKLAEPMDAEPLQVRHVLHDAQYIQSLASWMFALLVLFPPMFKEECMAQLLALIVADREYDVLFRDERVELRQELLQSTKAYVATLRETQKETAYSMVDVSAMQRMLKHSVKEMEKRHLATQTWLTLNLRTLLDTFGEIPAAIASKLPLVMALLHRIKHELIWTAVHCSSCKANDDIVKFWRTFCHFGELLHSAHRLCERVVEYRPIIYDYYAQVMRLDAAKLQSEFWRVQYSSALDGKLKTVLSELVSQFSGNGSSSERQTKCVHLRMDSYRIQCSLSSAQLPHSWRSECRDLLTALKKLSDDSRMAQNIEQELGHCTPLKLLWYYPIAMQPLLHVLLDIHTTRPVPELQYLKYGTVASRNISRYWNVFLRICEYGIQNVHPEFGNEQRDLGLATRQRCEQYLGKVCEAVTQCLNQILSQKYALHRQTTPEMVCEQLLATNRITSFAGVESYRGVDGTYAEQLSTLQQHMQLLSGILYGFSEIDSLPIFTQYLYPNAYLYESISHWFSQKLSSMFKHEHRTIPTRNATSKLVQGFVLPSKALAFLNETFSTLSILDEQLHLNVAGMIKQTLFEQFYVPDDAKAAAANGAVHGNGGKKLIENVCEFYTTLLEYTYVEGTQNYMMRELHGLYSPHTLSWIANIHDVIGGSLQDLCCQKELESLCTIIGVHGVRTLDRRILAQIAYSLHVCSAQIAENVQYQKIFDKVCTDGIESLQHVHFLMTNKHAIKLLNLCNLHALRIGAYVQFRKILKLAFKNVVQKRAAFEMQSVDVMQNALRLVKSKQAEADAQEEEEKNGDADAATVEADKNLCRTLQQMMATYAVDDDGADLSVLTHILQSTYAVQQAQMSVIQRLVMFTSIAFLSQDFWNQHTYSKFDIEIGNFRNNGIALVDCVDLLFDAFYGTRYSHEQVRSCKLKWLNTAVYAVTELLNVTKNNGKNSRNALSFIKYAHIENLLIFLDVFVATHHRHLYPSDLQEGPINVYDLIRAQMIRICAVQNDPYTTFIDDAALSGYDLAHDDDKPNDGANQDAPRKGSEQSL